MTKADNEVRKNNSEYPEYQEYPEYLKHQEYSERRGYPEYQKYPEHREYGGSGFIAAWTILIVLALVLAFTGRLLGYEQNPLPIHTPLLALLTGLVSVVCIVIGCFVFLKRKTKSRAMTKRRGIMLAVLGVFMLVGFFVFNNMIPLIFG